MFLRRICRNFAAVRDSFEVQDIYTLMFKLPQERPQALKNVIQSLSDHHSNLTHIESMPTNVLDSESGYTFLLDFQAPDNQEFQQVIQEVKQVCQDVSVVGSQEVPWFPRKLSDLNQLTQDIYRLPLDHPGYSDPNFWSRRQELGNTAMKVSIADPIPEIDYTTEETKTWETLLKALNPLLPGVACRDFLKGLEEMRRKGLIQQNKVPQTKDINQWLKEKSDFTLKPIAYICNTRDFLNCLAFRVFPLSWHVRHPNKPYFSMDSDLAHFAIGHAPLLANPEFADFVQELGLASLGAIQDDIDRLMRLYVYSVELGVTTDFSGAKEIYGARILSSPEEIQNCLSKARKWKPFNPYKVSYKMYDSEHLQSTYYYSTDWRETKAACIKFESSLTRPFRATFDRCNKVVKVDHKIRTV